MRTHNGGREQLVNVQAKRKRHAVSDLGAKVTHEAEALELNAQHVGHAVD